MKKGRRKWAGQRAAPQEPPSYDEGTLHRLALAHLNRFDASVSGLRTTLMRKVKNTLHKCDLSEEERARRITEADRTLRALLERFQGSGLLDDGRFAGNLVSSWRQRGMSARAIRARLLAKGVNAGIADAALSTHRGEQSVGASEIDAATAFARRRKLGCFSGKAQDRASARRDMARMARAGFDFEVAQRALNLRGGDDEVF
jgi:regulatory protein